MALSSVTLTFNGDAVPVLPNSVTWTEGQPEKMVRSVVVGNTVVQEFSKNFEEAFSKLNFAVIPSALRVDQIRAFQNLDNTNVVTVTATEVVAGAEQSLERTFNNLTIVNQPEINIGADTQVDIECKSDAAV